MKALGLSALIILGIALPAWAGDTVINRADGSRVHIITNDLGSTATIYDKAGKVVQIKKHPTFAGTAAHYQLVDQYRNPPSRADLPVPLPGRGTPAQVKTPPSRGALPVPLPGQGMPAQVKTPPSRKATPIEIP